ncbi:hypothetical protein ACRBEV_09970 [Methylobacterium phyllosphaerae]
MIDAIFPKRLGSERPEIRSRGAAPAIGTAPYARRRSDGVALGLTAIATAAYLWAAFAAARHSYWMDEVLAVWTARRGSAAAVWEALRQGAEFSPPLYHYLLRTLLVLGLDDPVILRLPSIAAIYGVALAAFVLVRRRYGIPVACLALVFCLAGPLFSYAVQVRQYALVAACFALACALWDVPAERPVSALRAAGIAILLSFAVGMHFYAILLAVALGLMEAGWMIRHRRIRWPIVLALFASAVSLLCWLPIMQAVSAFNHGDAAAPGYYARPTIARLLATYLLMTAGGDPLPPYPLAIVLTGLALRWRAGRRALPSGDDLDLVTGVVCAVPLIVYAFALAVTGTFNPRYVIVTALGISLVVARSVAAHRHGAVLSCVLIPVAIMAFLSGGEPMRTVRREDAIALVSHAPGALPIATGNAQRFFEITEALGRAPSRRLTFLQVTDQGRNPDPTNEHQVDRWTHIDPALPIRPIEPFLADNPEFLLFIDTAIPDMAAAYLQQRGYVSTLIMAGSGMTLTRFRRPVSKSEPR